MAFKLFAIDAIMHQKYMFGFAEHSDKYKEYKEKYGNKGKFWLLYTNLVSNMEAWQRYSRRQWAAGIRPGTMVMDYSSWRSHKGRMVNLAKIGMWLEEGNRKGKQPPRPLFLRLSLKYSYDRTKWFKIGRDGLNDFEKLWR